MELIYEKLIDLVACALWDLTESDTLEEVKGLTYKSNWLSNFINKYDGSEHAGDCTNQPFACDQCIIDGYREHAQSIIDKEAFIKYITDKEILEYMQTHANTEVVNDI